MSAAVIIECIQEYDRHRAPRTGGLRVVSPAGRSVPTAAEQVASLLDNPVRAALRGKVRDIGWVAFASGGRAGLQRLYDAVCDESGSARVSSVLDKWFNGIGDEAERWVA